MQQNILFRVREDKYRSRIKVLETLAAGAPQENEVLLSHSFSLFLFRLLIGLSIIFFVADCYELYGTYEGILLIQYVSSP